MTDARRAGADPGARGRARAPGGRAHPRGHPVIAYFRANPQVFALLLICLVLGLGTFIAVLVSLVTAGSDQTTGDPSGAIFGAHSALTAARWLLL